MHGTLPGNTRLLPADAPASAVLTALQDPACQLALIDRLLPPDLTAYLRGRQFVGCQAIDVTMPPETDANAVESLLAAAGYPRHPGRLALAVDIRELMNLLSHLLPTGAVRMRLERITTDACRLFHTDTLPLRLVCSYRGAGTDWLDEAACDRTALGKGNNARICRTPDGVHRMPEYAVGLMKGNRWPGQAGPLPSGLVHRSPPLPPGAWRLFLSLDALPD